MTIDTQPEKITTIQKSVGPGCLIQALWFIFIGWWLGALSIAFAWFLNITIIGLPLGMAILTVRTSRRPAVPAGACEPVLLDLRGLRVKPAMLREPVPPTAGPGRRCGPGEASGSDFAALDAVPQAE